MADPKDEKKKIETCKKDFQLELKKLTMKVKKPRLKLVELGELKLKLDKIKKPSPDQKTQLKKVIDVRAALIKVIEKDANDAGKRLDLLLKNSVPDDKKALPEWQKGMDKWYVDMLNKESGFDIGHGLRLSGDLSIKKKKASFTISGKF